MREHTDLSAIAGGEVVLDPDARQLSFSDYWHRHSLPPSTRPPSRNLCTSWFASVIVTDLESGGRSTRFVRGGCHYSLTHVC